MSRLSAVDVCVVGAGPAGCVLATRLARLGRTVLLVERAPFPRGRVGESLSPGVVPALAAIEAQWVLEGTGARTVEMVRRLWGSSAESRLDARAEGRIVDRALFDAALLAHARAHGVQVLQPAQITAWHSDATGGVRLQIEAHAGGPCGTPQAMTVRADAVALATGRTGAGARARGITPHGRRTFALYAYWTGGHEPSPAIESLRDAWCWGVPIPGRGYNALAFVDRERLRTATSPEALYREVLAQSLLVAPAVTAVRASRVHVVDATPLCARVLRPEAVAAPVIRVGDAALALDPLSSSGVQKAIQHALASAIVLHAMLRGGAARALAKRFHDEQLERAAARHATATAAHYAAVRDVWPDAPFWRDRAAGHEGNDGDSREPWPMPHPDSPLAVSPRAVVAPVPCLGEADVYLAHAIVHPEFDAPVAFVRDHPVADLLARVQHGMSANAIVQQWQIGMQEGRAIVRWMVQNGVLQPAPAEAAAPFPMATMSNGMTA